MNDGGGNGASCGGIKLRTDTTKLSDMVIARFGDGRNLDGESKMFIKGCQQLDTPRLRAELVVLSEELCILSSCFLCPISNNLVFEELRVRRLAVIQKEIC